ncbi:MAG: 8-amino-7-oxononanoate synthase [Magnetospirillum sp. WYHS-4]
MGQLDDRLEQALAGIRRAGAWRELRPCRPQPGGIVVRGDRRLVDFSSNDYLGLARHPEVIGRAARWAEEWGAGARASRLVTGTLEIHAAVEAKLARLKGTQAALIFNSGYQANAAILPALLDRDMLGAEPLVFADRLIHASLHAGLAQVRQIRFHHNDMDHLESLLRANAGKPGVRFIVTESVFSMDGDRPDLRALVGLAEHHGAVLYLDEAHATGVLGPKGMGLSGLYPGRVEIAMGTFSKGMGSFGAYVAGSRKLCDWLVNRSAGFIYATALPPAVLGAIDAALDLVPDLEAERFLLRSHAERARQALGAAGLDTLASDSQIVPAVIGSPEKALEASRYLEDRGVLGIAIRPPTVPQGTSRIRLAMSAAHGEAELGLLLDAVPGLAGFRS